MKQNGVSMRQRSVASFGQASVYMGQNNVPFRQRSMSKKYIRIPHDRLTPQLPVPFDLQRYPAQRIFVGLMQSDCKLEAPIGGSE